MIKRLTRWAVDNPWKAQAIVALLYVLACVAFALFA